MLKMDCSTDILGLWKKLTVSTVKDIKKINCVLEEQIMRLDISYNKLLQCAQNEIVNYGPEKKTSKRQSKAKSGQVGDLFSTESGFQQPAVPPVRRTKRQASILALDKMKGIRESTTIASGGSSLRVSRARALSSLMDINPLDCPKANSTFVVDKKLIGNKEDCLSPDIFPIDNETYIKPNNANHTYMLAKNTSKKMDVNINLIPAESPNVKDNSVASAKKATIKKKSENSPLKNKRREKLEDIDVNISEQPPQHMTRTMKRKLQEENQIDSKKTNVVHVLLEKQISAPIKPLEDPVKLHQVREQFAVKRKEIHLKSKADQKKIDAQHLKVANKKEELMKRAEEKLKKAAEEKKRKEEKQKERELMLKEEALKKQKQAELRLAEINAKRKQADDAKKLKMQKTELKEEVKKKIDLKQENSKSVRSKVGGTPLLSKVVNVSKSKDETNHNDYGLNDVSARDSSDDESVPKKPVPNWAKRENRGTVLELQYHVDSKERDLFFDCPKNISLKEMFKGWNIRDKQRTSSAVWNTPPRYSEYVRRNC